MGEEIKVSMKGSNNVRAGKMASWRCQSKVSGLNAPEVKQFQEMLEVPEGDYDGKFQRVGG